MKVVWSLIALLVIAAGVVVFRPDAAVPVPAIEAAAPILTRADRPARPAQPEFEPPAATATEPEPEPAAASETPDAQPEPQTELATDLIDELAAVPVVPQPEPQLSELQQAVIEEAQPASAIDLADAPETSAEFAEAPAVAIEADAAPEPAIQPDPVPTPQPEPTAVAQAEPEPQLEAEPAAAGFEIGPDGGLVIISAAGVRTTVPGAGTTESPYELDWRVLTSIQQTYAPDAGKTDLPEWAGALEGKRVRVTGHLLLPLVATGTSELLVMQNPWDGCCLGVPPTPYDAVEVRLNAPMNTAGGLANYGTIEGTISVDPYVVSGFLLGLYLMDDATVTQASGVGAGGF